MTNLDKNLKLYNAFYTYHGEVDGDVFTVGRNLWTVAGKDESDAEKAFWASKKEIESELRKTNSTREIASLDTLLEINVKGYDIAVRPNS